MVNVGMAFVMMTLSGWQAGASMREFRAGDMRFAGIHGALAAWCGLQCTLATIGIYA